MSSRHCRRNLRLFRADAPLWPFLLLLVLATMNHIPPSSTFHSFSTLENWTREMTGLVEKEMREKCILLCLIYTITCFIKKIRLGLVSKLLAKENERKMYNYYTIPLLLSLLFYFQPKKSLLFI